MKIFLNLYMGMATINICNEKEIISYFQIFEVYYKSGINIFEVILGITTINI